jgi:hypothetical protein
VDELFDAGQLGWCIQANGVLVEAPLDGGPGYVREADAAIERLTAASLDDCFAARDITLLRLRALLARARGDEVAYQDLVDRYRAMATAHGFEGHVATARR